VLEHVYREALPRMIADTHRIIASDGWAVHSIDTSDHLSHYDGSVSKKYYLTVSETMWKRVYENEVQYINRMQRNDWTDLFTRSGFDIVEQDSRQVDISRLTLADRYAANDAEDLASTVVRVALRKRSDSLASSPRK
jgi:hypothetical protein